MRYKALLAVAVCFLAVAIRVKFARQLSWLEWMGTENEYVAAALARGEGWAGAYHDASPTAHVPPLYPLLLSGVYRLFGAFQTLPGRLVQQALSITVATLVLLFLPVVARKLGLSTVAGWVAAFVAACLPANLRDEVTGHQNQVIAALALLGLIWVLAHLRQSSWQGRRAVLAAGVLLGVISLLCPNLLAVPVLFFAVEWFLGRGERKRILRRGLVLALFVLAFLTPWTVRNYLVLGGFVPFCSNFGLELAVGNRPGANGHTYQRGFDDIHPFMNPIEYEYLRQMGELAYMKDKQRQAASWIADHPRRFVWLTARRAFLFWFTTDERWYQPIPRWKLSIRIYGLMGVLALLEMGRLLLRRHPSGRLLLCAALGVSAPYLVTHVEMRYRLPLVGLFALLSCDFLIVAAQWVHQRTRTWKRTTPLCPGISRPVISQRRISEPASFNCVVNTAGRSD
jgi:hypothetical protein